MLNETKNILDIIKKFFSNGIRDDFIDVKKILCLCSAEYPEKNFSVNFIRYVIHAEGIKVGKRFYFVSENDIEKILLFFDAILKNYSVVYYSVAYEKHRKFFSKLNIFSPEILKKILQENDGENLHLVHFCVLNKKIRLEDEISKVFTKSDISLSLEDLQKIFPYVPEKKISAELKTKKYLPTVTGKYFSVSKIKFDTTEIFEAEKKILASGEYDFSSNFALNPEISEKNMIGLIFRKFFAGRFLLRGKKFYKRNISSANFIKTALENFLENKEKIAFTELLNFSKKICDNSSNSFFTALNYGFKFMVRVDENLFVKDSLVNFDVAGIDEALTPFVQNKIVSLRSVKSFTDFPPVENFSWNLFLLESFLRKYSKKFSYNAPNINNVHVGAIYPKSRRFSDYLGLQAEVIIQENIVLEKSAIENFLVEQGYRSKKIDKFTRKIIYQAQENLIL